MLFVRLAKGGGAPVTEIEQMAEIAADLAFVESLRRMKAQFQSEIAAASASQDDDVIDALHQESFYQLSEFFFAIRTHRIDNAEKLGHFATLHNAHLVRLSEDRNRMRRYGLSAQRINAAVFNEEALEKLIANYSGSTPGIDQSDLARLLVTVMSTETCRKMVLAAEKAGFVERTRSPFGPVLVRSHGNMEGVYGAAIRGARHAAKHA